ncbi:MAG: AMP-binding protein [Treponema sp.]|jgi:long-chain acyl-CoA synthetase|nr:AMP-binding protein [Treponema sp.]
MATKRAELPWAFLDNWRGKTFTGDWPTLPQMFDISAERYADRPCFTDFEGPDGKKNTLTYKEVHQYMLQTAAWLTAAGIRKGDKVAVSGKNSPEWGTVYFGALYAGAVIVPVDYALHEKEMDNLLNTAKPKILFVDEEKYAYFSHDHEGLAVYALSPKHADRYVYNLKSSAAVEKNPPAEPDDLAAILFTSGTTGIPKGVMLTHRNFVSDCYIAQTNLDIFAEDTFYALLPIHHAYTMQAAFIEPLSVGAEIVFGKSMAVSRLMKELKEGRITIMLGVPLLYNKLLAGVKKGVRAKGPVVAVVMKFLMGLSYLIKKIFKKNPGKVLFRAVLEQANIYTLRVAICGGGPLAASVFRAYNEAGIDFIQGYGLTETSPIIALNPLDHFKINSVGRDFSPWEEMKILDPDEEGIGEVAVKGPMVMKGYYNMPEETAALMTPDGFLKTGDIGRLDSEHYLILMGRAKNIIVTEGGKNVYPEEIEDSFQLYDDIEQITVQKYMEKAASKAEGIEALIYPADQVYERLKVSRNDPVSDADVLAEINESVDKVNRTLQPYARITKVTILSEPLEMTTTRKVKRNYSN